MLKTYIRQRYIKIEIHLREENLSITRFYQKSREVLCPLNKLLLTDCT